MGVRMTDPESAPTPTKGGGAFSCVSGIGLRPADRHHNDHRGHVAESHHRSRLRQRRHRPRTGRPRGAAPNGYTGWYRVKPPPDFKIAARPVAALTARCRTPLSDTTRGGSAQQCPSHPRVRGTLRRAYGRPAAHSRRRPLVGSAGDCRSRASFSTSPASNRWSKLIRFLFLRHRRWCTTARAPRP